MSFSLHPRLAAGTHRLGIVNGCHVLLKNNACFPWILVVPEVDGEEIEDLHQLKPERYVEVMDLVHVVSTFVSDFFQPDKLNVACIGNQVRQMHIHIVGRFESDVAWPGTVWASDAKEVYTEERVDEVRAAIVERLD